MNNTSFHKTWKGVQKQQQLEVADVTFLRIMASVEGFTTLSPQTGADQLKSVLQSWNFRRVEVHGDGNRLFTAISLAIINQADNGDMSLIRMLIKKNIITDIHECNVTTLASALRKAMVNEWMGENYDLYQGLVTI